MDTAQIAQSNIKLTHVSRASPEEGCCSQQTDVNLVWISGGDNHLQQRAFLGFFCCLLSVCRRIPRRQSHIINVWALSVCVCSETKPLQRRVVKEERWQENLYSKIKKQRDTICHSPLLLYYHYCLLLMYYWFCPWRTACPPINISACKMFLESSLGRLQCCSAQKRQFIWGDEVNISDLK